MQPEEKSNKLLSRRIKASWKTFIYSLLFIFILVFFGFLLFYIIDEFASISENTKTRLGITLLFVAPYLATFLLLSYMSSQGRQTPGQRHMGLVVVDRKGNYLSFPKSILRNILCILSVLPFGIGILWVAFTSSGSGWHDIILGTRVASTKQKNEKGLPELKPASINMVIEPMSSKMAVVTYALFTASFFILLVSIATMAGMISSLNLFYYSLIFFGVSMLFAFIFGFRSVDFIRKNALKLFFSSGIAFVLFLVYLPANRTISLLETERKIEADLIGLGEAAEHYHEINNKYPGSLEEISSDPHHLNAYIYKIEKINGKEYFVIKKEYYNNLIKENGLAPPKKIKGMEYVHGKGLIIKTE
ncbi:MAG: RDD family protein [Desulfobacterales bacterium]|nr:RDD family protein [Desulfobacterales bacterium]